MTAPWLKAVLPFVALPVMALALLAASPPPGRGKGLSLELAPPPRAAAPAPPAQVPQTGFEPAPLPNRDIDGPVAPRASNEPSLSPSLFTRKDTYRGEGFAPGSTATSEQEKRVKPGAGFNLRMPFAPN